MYSNIHLVSTKCGKNANSDIIPRGLEQHPPIRIISDKDFIDYDIPGLGSENHPYFIRNLNITTNEETGIYISSTTKHIVICNCYIDALNYGIEIENVANDTLVITQNTCINNRYYGTFIWKTAYANISYNNYVQNGDGVTIFNSDKAIITNNTCNKNKNYGIYLSRSKYCNVTYNVLKNNKNYGVVLGRYTEYISVHHNYFISNNLGGTSQAYDHGSNNLFYDLETNEGNWWNDWLEGYYVIDGNTFSVDFYPLGESLNGEKTEETPFNLLPFIILLPVIVAVFLLRKSNKKIRTK